MAGEMGTQEVQPVQTHDGALSEGMGVDNNVAPPGSGVRDDINAAMKELGMEVPDGDEDGENNRGDEGTQETQGDAPDARDEGERGATQEDGAQHQETDGEKQPTGEEQRVDTGLDAPEAWGAAQKESFGKLPDDQKQFVLDAFKGMEAAHTRRTQAVTPILEVASKWGAYLQSRQMTPHQALDYLISAEHQLSTGTQEQKQQALLGLMEAYGVDPLELAATAEEKVEEPEVDPGMKKLLDPVTQSVADLHRRMDAREAQGTQEQQMTDLEAFAAAKDADGKPLHPHFDTLVDDMLVLAQARTSQGRTVTYQDLYEEAQWLNPDVRKQLLEAQSEDARKAAGQQHANARRAAVRGAKESSTKVNGQTNGEVQEQPRETVSEELHFQARKLGLMK